jgi:hypothetical protein
MPFRDGNLVSQQGMDLAPVAVLVEPEMPDAYDDVQTIGGALDTQGFGLSRAIDGSRKSAVGIGTAIA